MNCPHCASQRTQERNKKTVLGYRTFRCSACHHNFNERTGTPFNFLEYPTDLVLLVILWRLRYKLSLRDLGLDVRANVVLRSRMKRCEIGKHALHHS